MIITISRQYGAGGSETARRVASALGWRVVDNELVEEVAARAGLPPADVAEREERVPSFAERLARTLAAATPELFAARSAWRDRSQASGSRPGTDHGNGGRRAGGKGKVVLVGRAAPAVLARERDSLHVQLVAPRAYRIQAAAERLGVDPDQAARTVDETDRARAAYLRQYYRRDWYDPVNYHMVLNTGLLGLDGVTDLILNEAARRGWTSTRS